MRVDGQAAAFVFDSWACSYQRSLFTQVTLGIGADGAIRGIAEFCRAAVSELGSTSRLTVASQAWPRSRRHGTAITETRVAATSPECCG